MKVKFVEFTKAELEHITRKRICEKCCLVGRSACSQMKCMPQERCDKKRGYYVEEKEVTP